MDTEEISNLVTTLTMKMSNLGTEYFVKGEWKIINDIQWKGYTRDRLKRYNLRYI
jgi:hypothetical protein